MEEIGFVVTKLFPVLSLILLGVILNRTGILKEADTHRIKGLIVNASLPAVLWLSFYKMELSTSFIPIIVGIFVLNFGMYWFGKWVCRWRSGNYTPFLYTGFEYGMFSFGVFATAYGQANISYIAVVDLGHELFIWFIFVTLLLARSGSGGGRSWKEVLLSFIRSPVIIAILLGLAANSAGLARLESTFVWSGVIASMEALGSITGPLVLILIGAGLTLKSKALGFAFKSVLVRVPAMLALATLGGFIMKKVGLHDGYIAALFTLCASPPPFIIPLFMPPGDDELGQINTTLTLSTLVALVLFTVYFFLNPVL